MGDRVRLNVDSGERADEDEALLALADLLNVACGGHAGDDASMRRVVGIALAHGAGIGAHPSYVDREGFGRRSLHVSPRVLKDEVRAQCLALRAVAEAEGATVGHVKLHGALYHDAMRDAAIAQAALDGATLALGSVAVLGAPGGELEACAARAGRSFLREGFADRRRGADGRLIPRSDPRALVDNPEEARAILRALAGQVETVCVHADTPRALEIARAVREELCAIDAR